MISGNRRIPLIYSNQKEKEPQHFRYVPEKLRVVKLRCLCPPYVPPVNVVGVGSGANTLLYSRDGGLTWTGLGNSIFSGEGNCAAWNGTMWVAGGFGTNALAYSYDGINWTGIPDVRINPFTSMTSCTSIVWTGTTWVAVNGLYSATSIDGITWRGFDNSFSGLYTGYIATNGTIIVGIPTPDAGINIRVSKSSDGESWGPVIDTNLDNERISTYGDILYDGTQFILLVKDRVEPNNSKFYSTNGASWTGIPNVGYVKGTNIGKTTGNLYISRGTDSNSTEKSIDGINWITVTNPSLPIVQGIPGTIFGTDSQIFVCGYNNNSFIYSTNGLTWTTSNTGVSGNFKAGFFKN